MFKALVVASLFVGTLASANDAGCGLGSMIIKDNSKVMQILAATTNGTSWSQTFGITFGTSNCTAKNIVKNDKQIQYFVEVNQAELTREMAQGHGNKLSTLAALNGCTTDAQVSTFNTQAQSNFKTIVPAAKTSSVDFVNNLKNSNVANVCHGA